MENVFHLVSSSLSKAKGYGFYRFVANHKKKQRKLMPVFGVLRRMRVLSLKSGNHKRQNIQSVIRHHFNAVFSLKLVDAVPHYLV